MAVSTAAVGIRSHRAQFGARAASGRPTPGLRSSQSASLLLAALAFVLLGSGAEAVRSTIARVTASRHTVDMTRIADRPQEAAAEAKLSLPGVDERATASTSVQERLAWSLCTWPGALTPLRLMGQGSFGYVFEASVAGADAPVAVKVSAMPLPSAEQDSVARQKEMFSQELDNEQDAIRRFQSHEFIKVYRTVRFDYSVKDEHYPAMLLVMEKGNATFLELDRALAGIEDEDRRLVMKLRLFIEVLRALSRMYQRGYMHLDVKPSNIVILGNCSSSEGCHARLIDFAFACQFSQRCPAVGTFRYRAPETFSVEWLAAQRDGKADVWSAGCVLYSLFPGHWSVPKSFEQEWDAAQARGAPERSAAQKLNIADDEDFRVMVKGAHRPWGELIGDMLQVRTTHRIDMTSALDRATAIMDSMTTLPGLYMAMSKLP